MTSNSSTNFWGRIGKRFHLFFWLRLNSLFQSRTNFSFIKGKKHCFTLIQKINIEVMACKLNRCKHGYRLLNYKLASVKFMWSDFSTFFPNFFYFILRPKFNVLIFPFLVDGFWRVLWSSRVSFTTFSSSFQRIFIPREAEAAMLCWELRCLKSMRNFTVGC